MTLFSQSVFELHVTLATQAWRAALCCHTAENSPSHAYLLSALMVVVVKQSPVGTGMHVTSMPLRMEGIITVCLKHSCSKVAYLVRLKVLFFFNNGQ